MSDKLLDELEAAEIQEKDVEIWKLRAQLAEARKVIEPFTRTTSYSSEIFVLPSFQEHARASDFLAKFNAENEP